MSAISRIKKYIDERGKLRGIDIEHIHGLHCGTEQGATLLLSDIKTLIAQTEQAWIPITDELPEPGVPVIALVNPNEYGKKRRIRAMWAPAKTLELALDAEGGEYDEETDKYYCEEGWYETNEYEEVHWNVSGTVTHWQPLPAYPEP